MDVRIETSSEKKLIGKRIKMSVSTSHKNLELWKSFAPRKKEIINSIDIGFHSVEIYPPGYFHNFNLDTEFEKWAAVEVKNFETVPNGMEMVTIKSGLYAVFLYKGDSSKAFQIFEHIFKDWLPKSNYRVDDRPHFEVMGEKYKTGDPNSEEELWVPIRKKLSNE